MASKLSRWILSLFGWRVVGGYPAGLRKSICVVIPHTSNWDFPLGILARKAIGVDIKFLGKSSLFRPPHGWLFRWLNGFPIDRSKSNNFVQAMVESFQKEEELHIVISPEGTRSRTDKLKTGFYYMAKGAGVPLILCSFDWEKKAVTFGEPFYVTGDQTADFQVIENYFKGIKGKHPELGYLYEG